MTDGDQMHRRLGTAIVAALMTGAFALIPSVTANATVTANPAATPQIGGSPTSGTDGTIEFVQQLTQCGNTMYAVGVFTQVRNPKSTTPIARNNAFAFNANAPYTITGWNPNVNGEVDTAACAPDGNIFLGGSFTTVGGGAAKNFVKVNATTGARMTFGFANPAGKVNHMEVATDAAGVQHLLVGGNAAPYLRSLSPTTGANDHYFDSVLPISGHYVFPNSATNTTKIYNMTLSPANVPASQRAVLMTGVFTAVGTPAQHKEQIVRVNLTPTRATVSQWVATELYLHCLTRQPFYAQDAAFSLDMTKVYTATTGFHLSTEPAIAPQHREGPCDATIMYDATEKAVNGHLAINYTGCDSLFSVAVDGNTVYAGGHQRYQNDGEQCTTRTTTTGGPGSVPAMGLATMSPVNLSPVPGPQRGGRGLGVPDLLVTPAGLWIASDNQANTNKCADQSGHMGICFLPNP